MPHVTVDAELVELVPSYIEKRKTEVSALKSFFEKNQLDEIAKVAHKVKGTAASYGFIELTDISGKIESLAQGDNMAELKRQIDLFKTYVETVTW